MDLGSSHAEEGKLTGWSLGKRDHQFEEEELYVFAERVNLGGFDNKQHA